jgi:enoyl-CoA hydratase/carnithine racemase
MTTENRPSGPPEPVDDESGGNPVLYEKREGGIAVITLHRPGVLNAMNSALSQALMAALTDADADDDVRAVILRGAGRAFSAGGDITESSRRVLANDSGAEQGAPGGGAHLKVWEMGKPVIAAVHGFAIGLAFELAGICDFTVLAEDAKVGEIQIRHGYGPPILMTPYVVTLKRAKEILLLGDMVDAKDALTMGLVNRVVPADKVMEEAESIAQRIAALPQATVKMNKALINRSYEIAGFRSALSYRDDPDFADLWKTSQQDDETRERLQVLQDKGWEAFRNERDARYHGRSAEEEAAARDKGE